MTVGTINCIIGVARVSKMEPLATKMIDDGRSFNLSLYFGNTLLVLRFDNRDHLALLMHLFQQMNQYNSNSPN